MEASSQIASPAEPPKPFRQTAPDRLELKEGGGCLALFGLPFFAAGVLMALAVTGLLPMHVEANKKWTPLALGAMAVLFTATGAIMVFGRQWLIIDLTRRCVIRQYGLLLPFRTHERLLSEFNALLIVHDPGNSDSPERFPVRFRALNGQDFIISKPGKFGESLAQAEYLSALLRLPLVDTTTDHETLVDSGKGVLNLQERAITEEETPAPTRPPKMRALVTETAEKAILVIPTGGSWIAGALGIVFPLFVLLVVLPGIMRFFARANAPHFIQYGFLLFLTLIFVLPTLIGSLNLMVGSKRKRMTVTATPDGLTLEQRTAWRKHSKFVPIADLLDIDCSTIDGAIRSVKASSARFNSASPGAERLVQVLKKYVPSKGIIVKTRSELLTFGEGLPADELRYVLWVLRRALGGHQPAGVTKVSGE